MKELLEYILTAIIDNPDQLTIEEEQEDTIHRFNVSLAEADYPRVIGKHGLTIKAITDIIRTYNAKTAEGEREHVYINIRS